MLSFPAFFLSFLPCVMIGYCGMVLIYSLGYCGMLLIFIGSIIGLLVGRCDKSYHVGGCILGLWERLVWGD